MEDFVEKLIKISEFCVRDIRLTQVSDMSGVDGLEGMIEDLIKSITRMECIDEKTVKRSLRLIRPTNNDPLIHNTAIKMRIRQSLLLKYGEDVDGPSAVSDFEKQVESLRRMKSKHLHSFLLLLEQLSFSDTSKQSKSLFSFPTDKKDENQEESVSSPASSAVAKEAPLPYGVPPPLSEDEVTMINDKTLWVSKDVEMLLLRDLLLVFQGINGKHIRLDERSQSYVIDPRLVVPGPPRDVVLCLCEVGWLYSKLDAYIKLVERVESRGLVAQALGFALQEALHEYYRLLAVLEQELSRTLIQEEHKSHTPGDDNHDEGSRGLTLLRLRVWMQEPLDRMCLLARVVESAEPLTGGGLLSRLHGFAFHGDEKVERFVHRSIMLSVCAPLYGMVARWVLHGELRDPHREFFIATRSPAEGLASVGARGQSGGHFDSSSADFVWHSYYRLHPTMLPSFIHTKLAHKILVVGKSINFMKACMRHGGRDDSAGEERGLSEPSMALALGGGVTSIPSATGNETCIELSSQFEDRLRGMTYGREGELEAVVFSVAAVIETKLMALVQGRFHLGTHLAALKKFMLLGQGDFVTCLMDNIGGELKRRANQLFRHNLTGLLEASLRSCNAQFEPSFVLDRLGVRLLEPSPGDTGWEIFSLDYAIDPPIAAVVHSEAVSKYRSAFHMLWRMKRVEWALTGTWRAQVSFLHTRGHQHLKKLKPILHRCALERGKMTHFINNLNNFLMFEVVETSWRRMEEGVAGSTCLDDIIRVHDEYLASIQERALLSESHEALNVQIQQVIQAILRFCNLEETLVTDALAVAARRNHEGHVGWSGGVGVAPVDSGPGTIDGVPGYVVSRLEEAAQNYEAQFQRMIRMLEDQGEKAGELTRYLFFHLDIDGLSPPDEDEGTGDESPVDMVNTSDATGRAIAREDIDGVPTVPPSRNGRDGDADAMRRKLREATTSSVRFSSGADQKTSQSSQQYTRKTSETTQKSTYVRDSSRDSSTRNYTG